MLDKIRANFMEEEVPFISIKASLSGRSYVYTSILEGKLVKWKACELCNQTN